MNNSMASFLVFGMISATPLVANSQEHSEACTPDQTTKTRLSQEKAKEIFGYESQSFHSETVEIQFDALGNLCSIVDVAVVDNESQPNC